MATAGIEQITVVDGGFLVTEETLNAVETKLAQVDQLNTTISDLNTQLAAVPETHAQALADKDKQIQDLQATVTAHESTITELNTKLAKPADDFTTVGAGATGDHQTGEKNKYMTSYDLEAQKIREARGEN
jgi:hypothetical protein